MVMIEQVTLIAPPVVGKPMQRHHVGEIVGGDINAPGGPVEEAHIVTAVARQEHVPDMRVAVEERHVAVCVVARVQTMPFLDQPLIDSATLGGQPVTDAIGKAGEFFRELSNLRIVRFEPSADRRTRVVPQRGVKPRPRRDDRLALRPRSAASANTSA